MTLKVIGAGFGRTGTMSMKSALQKLGFVKCHHMNEVLPNAEQINLWHNIAVGADPDWDAIFEGYAASVDFPSSIFYKELAEKYPDAKVVLTTRDFEKWYTSATETIYAIGQAGPGWLKKIPRGRKIHEMVYGLLWDGFFGGKFEDKSHTEKLFHDHIAEVKASIPSDRLLVMEVKDGWEPLCAFLGCEVPDEPFPYVNEAEDFKKQIKFLDRLAYVPWAMGGVLALIAFLIFQYA